MTEFNPNCGRCGMLNSHGFCSLTACRYPSNVIAVEPKVIRGMMVNPQIETPKTNADRIRGMTDEELANFMEDTATWGGCPNHGARDCTSDCGMCWISWLKSPVEVENG